MEDITLETLAEQIQTSVESTSATEQNVAMVKDATGIIITKIDSLSEQIRAIHELTLNAPAQHQQAMVARGGAGPHSAAPQTPVTPHTMEITAKPFKKSQGGIALNTASVLRQLLILVTFEKDYPGSLDAVKHILKDCFLDFSTGTAPKDWTNADPATKSIAEAQMPFFETMFRTLINAQITPAVASLTSGAHESVRTASMQLSRGLKTPAMGIVFQWNLASLFQSVHPGMNVAATKTGSVKVHLSQSYLGQAFMQRLPSETKVSIGFTVVSEKTAVPHIMPLPVTGDTVAPQRQMNPPQFGQETGGSAV